MAAKTTADRQKRYREKRPFSGKEGNGERRLNTWISTGAHLAIERLARRYCVTKKDMLEKLILDEDQRLINGLKVETPEWHEYFGTGERTP